MWIKWKYNDHGAGGFKELEITPSMTESYGDPKSVICELGLVPTWGERFDMGRIEWHKIRKPSPDTVACMIKELKDGYKWRMKESKRLTELLKTL